MLLMFTAVVEYAQTLERIEISDLSIVSFIMTQRDEMSVANRFSTSWPIKVTIRFEINNHSSEGKLPLNVI